MIDWSTWDTGLVCENCGHTWGRHVPEDPQLCCGTEGTLFTSTCPCAGFRNPDSSPDESATQERSTMSTKTKDTVHTYQLPGGREYLARELGGFENDVEGMRELRKMGIHTALLGDPGVGKTALILAAFGDEVENDLGHDKMTAIDMMWRPRLLPDGNVIYDPSPLNRAVTKGHVFHLDEFMRCNADALTPLFSAMDGRGYIVGGNLDGTDMPIAEGFCVVGASNPLVRGAFMPDAIASRFHLLTIETSIELLERFDLDERLLVVWRNLKQQEDCWVPSIRDMLAAQKFIDVDNMHQAAYALTGWQIPSRDREKVAGVIRPLFGVRVGELGGTIK